MSETERLCPECGSTLHARATYCGCGWGRTKQGRAAPEERRTNCAYETCRRDAFVKVQTKTGWANLCLEHLREQSLSNSEAYCEKLGLDTVAKQKAWLRENLKTKFGRFARPLLPRQPGEDWSEDEAA